MIFCREARIFVVRDLLMLVSKPFSSQPVPGPMLEDLYRQA